ncbi:hypothetical protein MA16_Dca006897 [Dendrobium catenatum]|uniref:Defensin-like protein n=1 Tax=Dendrobium catenatum TaxID=906689 RepID=A0A2I0VT45_9ASPA|nr:hypothetical protein MA16_Dca006897 [Dendrobium catenatum]
MAPMVKADRICTEILNSNSCNVPACTYDCYNLKKGHGECIANKNKPGYACFCFYSC